MLILPLDGSAPTSVLPRLNSLGLDKDSVYLSIWRLGMQWSADSKAVGIYVDVGTEQGGGESLLVVHVDGRLLLFDQRGDRVIGGLNCDLPSGFPGGSESPWLIEGDTIWADGGCIEDDGQWQEGSLVFSFAGDVLRFEPSTARATRPDDEELVRGTHGAETLGESMHIRWSESRRHVLVVSYEENSLWLFDAEEELLRPVEIDREQVPEGANWDCGETGFCWRVWWHEDTRVAVMWPWDSTSVGGLVIEVADGSSEPMETWSLGYYPRLASHEWRPNGDLLKVRFWRPPEHSYAELFRRDGLVLSDPELSVVVIVRADGTPIQYLFPRWACSSEGWSDDGEWFVIADEVNTCFVGLR